MLYANVCLLEHEDYVSKVIYVFQRTCWCILDTWKKKHRVPITFLSLHWAIYRHKPVLHFCRTVQLTSEHAKCIYPILFIIAFVCLFVHTLEGDTGVNSQTSPVPLPQKFISSRPNPMKKLGENPVPLHSRKNDSHSLPLPCCCFFLPKSVSYSKNIVQITACPPY